MKHFLPCSIKKKSPHLNLRAISSKVTGSHVIETLWVLNNTLSNETLDELLASITEFCAINNLTIVSKPDQYHLTVSGTADDYSKAFNTSLSNYQLDNNDNVYYTCDTETLDVPHDWKDKVISIMGLDNYPCFHTYHILSKKLGDNNVVKNKDIGAKGLAPNNSPYFDPIQLATLYNFPSNLSGSGQKVGIIELSGGYVLSDVTTYFSQLGLIQTPNIVDVSVGGVTNDPNDGSGANIEVILDIEIVAAVVPAATINVYFSANSYSGFYNGIKQAIDDNCNVISISWGLAESYWPTSALSAYDSLFQTAVAKGITICVASGDNGSKDGTASNTVDFPSSSPNVLGCGGTRLVANSDKTVISSEVVWNNNSVSSATGGGISAYFPRPSYQNSVSYLSNKKRGVPDICGVADPNTGYLIYSQSEGGFIVVGGTSAVAPLWAGLYARLNQSLAGHVGFLNTNLYPHPTVCRDVVSGNNGGYSASLGWDACTGLGSPNGSALLTLLTDIVNGQPVTEPVPTPAPSNLPVVSFTVTRTSGNWPLAVKFNNTTTNANRFRWNFGDNTSSSLKNPVKIYKKPGLYSVTLVATNNYGSSSLTKNGFITVNGRRNR